MKGYRKLIFSVIAVAGITIAFCIKELPADVYEKCFIAVCIGFLGANAIGHIGKNGNGA